MANPNNPEYLAQQCPLPYSGSKSGYIRHDVDCNEVTDKDQGVVVAQKISGIEYRNFNTKYQKSVLEPVISTDITVNAHSDHVAITNGWNSKFIKQVWWDGSAYQDKVGGLSEKYVTQSLFKAWVLNVDGTQTEKMYDEYEYVHRDICNYEVTALFTTTSSIGELIVPLGDIFLALEGDRDNTIINEERTLAILLEDNTTLYQIDYENDYFVREEGDVSLSYESGALIEPA